MLTGCSRGLIMSRRSLGACSHAKIIRGLSLLATLSAAIEITAWVNDDDEPLISGNLVLRPLGVLEVCSESAATNDLV